MMKTNTVTDREELDSEWVELIKQAKELGLTKEEIKGFFYRKEDQMVVYKK
ncbi:anti-repressor SinI family protein [Pontibacillus yanchengensis]|nr:anti-repressor SinI family protein [Pontibacillus yanchengensis]